MNRCLSFSSYHQRKIFYSNISFDIIYSIVVYLYYCATDVEKLMFYCFFYIVSYVYFDEFFIPLKSEKFLVFLISIKSPYCLYKIRQVSSLCKKHFNVPICQCMNLQSYNLCMLVISEFALCIPLIAYFFISSLHFSYFFLVFPYFLLFISVFT